MLVMTAENTASHGLSARGVAMQQEFGGMSAQFRKVFQDLYDPKTNPSGLVNMGVAENYVMQPEAARFTNEHLRLNGYDFSYGSGPWTGDRLRRAMARHMNRTFHPRRSIEPDQLAFTNGLTSMSEALGFILFDEGDAVLMSSPMYQAFKFDYGTKAHVHCKFVTFDHDTDAFDVGCVGEYEQAIVASRSTSSPVKALILCNPHNPLGRCYSQEAIVGLMKLCNKYSVHLLVDEIYALSVYTVPGDPKARAFHSVLTFDTDEYIRPDYLHVLYGFSKDFAGGGLRIGCLYTRNELLLAALGATAMFYWSGNVNEEVGAAMLEDETWLDTFLETSRKKLATRNILARNLLDDAGVPYEPGSNAGFFLWIDLRQWVRKVKVESSPSGSNKVSWEQEDAFTALLMQQHKLFLTNGKSLTAPEPGWYRLIFAQDERVLHEGIKRLKALLKSM